jgi:hypothetical protein
MLFSQAVTCSWTPYFHDAYAPDEILVSDRGIRWGLLYEKAGTDS